MLKKFIALATMVLMLNSGVTLTLGTYSAVGGEVANRYKENGKAYTYITTEDGNGWVLDGRHKELKKGRKYAIIFDNKRTESIYDDEIIKLIEL